MPRISRGLVDGAIYHVLNRGNAKQRVYHDRNDYESFLFLLKEGQVKYSVILYAYCLMPNHYHMVIEPEHGTDMGKFMQWIMTSHVRRYHRKYGSSGHVWQGRYKSIMVQDESYAAILGDYVILNPVRAGLVKDPREWKWSSCDDDPLHWYAPDIGIIPEKYKNRGPLTDEHIKNIRECIIRGRPWGDPVWQKTICEQYGLSSTVNQRGRPRHR